MLVHGYKDVDHQAALNLLYLCAISLISIISLTGSAVASQKIGVAGGVKGDLLVSEGARPVAEMVESGMDMLMRDRVNSAAESRMQVLLLDETVFTIGPESDLIIDEFVYDPEARVGHLVANFSKGSMRYISGKLSHLNPAGITIKTPNASIGVRGTALFIMDDPESVDGTQFIGLLGPGDQNEVGLNPSRIEVTSGGVTVNILRAGYGVFVSPGKALSAPVSTPPRLVRKLQTKLTGVEEPRGVKGTKLPREAQTKMRKTRQGMNRITRGGRLDASILLAAAALSGREGALERIRLKSPRNTNLGKREVIATVKQIAKIGPRAALQRIQKVDRLRDRISERNMRTGP